MNQRPRQIALVLFLLLALMTARLHLGTLVLTALFGTLALDLLTFRNRRGLGATLYVILVLAITVSLGFFSSLAIRTLPHIAATSIPAMVEFAEHNGIDLPFTDFESLKSAAVDQVQMGITVIGQYATVASLQFLLLLAGIVVAVSIYLHPIWTVHPIDSAPADNLYTTVTGELSTRFRLFYQSFATVIGAQILISVINTVLTAIFLFSCGYPYILVLLVLVFLCGLLPIVGNLISNTLIVGVGFTLSPKMGLIALVFLVVIHKLEYFLDSKIIGTRINSPMWLTLIGLVVGERLMGVPGMVLAPVTLHYLRIEASAFRLRATPQDEKPPACPAPTES